MKQHVEIFPNAQFAFSGVFAIVLMNCKRYALRQRTPKGRTRDWGRRRGRKMCLGRGKANGREDDGLQFPEIVGVFLKWLLCYCLCVLLCAVVLLCCCVVVALLCCSIHNCSMKYMFNMQTQLDSALGPWLVRSLSIC